MLILAGFAKGFIIGMCSMSLFAYIGAMLMFDHDLDPAFGKIFIGPCGWVEPIIQFLLNIAVAIAKGIIKLSKKEK